MCVICYVTELRAYDFVIKEFVIKKGRYLCQTLYLFLHLLPMAFTSPSAENQWTLAPRGTAGIFQSHSGCVCLHFVCSLSYNLHVGEFTLFRCSVMNFDQLIPKIKEASNSIIPKFLGASLWLIPSPHTPVPDSHWTVFWPYRVFYKKSHKGNHIIRGLLSPASLT